MTGSADPATVLVVEDDASLNAALATTLKAAGFRPVTARTAAEGLRWFAHYAPDIVLLDLGLPDRDGLSVIADIRARSQTPIVVLSARDAEAMKGAALDLGADDYVQKPFGVDELLARLRAGLRHGVKARGSTPLVRTGDLEIDLGLRLITKGREPLKLSPKEYDTSGARSATRTCCARSGAAIAPISSICGSTSASFARSSAAPAGRLCW